MEGKLTFGDTLTVEQFKAQMMVSRVEGDTLDIAHAGQRGCTTFWLLHEEGQGGAPTLASF